jgi:hypothetical protein
MQEDTGVMSQAAGAVHGGGKPERTAQKTKESHVVLGGGFESLVHNGWLLLIAMIAIVLFSLNVWSLLPNQIARVFLSIF